MITDQELVTLIAICDQDLEECRKAKNAAKSFKNMRLANKELKQGKALLRKREYYQKCREAIKVFSADNLERQRNELMIKQSTIHKRAITHIHSITKREPDLKNQETKAQYDEHVSQYDLAGIKRQIKHLNFLLR